MQNKAEHRIRMLEMIGALVDETYLVFVIFLHDYMRGG